MARKRSFTRPQRVAGRLAFEQVAQCPRHPVRIAVTLDEIVIGAALARPDARWLHHLPR
jgi:hypothetical protein